MTIDDALRPFREPARGMWSAGVPPADAGGVPRRRPLWQKRARRRRDAAGISRRGRRRSV